MRNRTAGDFLKELEDKNISVAQWCRDHQMATSTVWAVVDGRVLGRSGEARRAMQLMKLPLPSARRNYPRKVRTSRKASTSAGAAA
jgi:hypothetical protein